MKDRWRGYDVNYSLIISLLQTVRIKEEVFVSFGRVA